ncbi:hypothetical protein FRC20_006964 [Serendipita sp. 405]|nr:hypothetical protein FRC20_006964 [Serendipita sp. 405]
MPRSAWGIPYVAGNFHWEISDGIICFTSGGGDGERPKTLHFSELLAPTDEQYNPFELDPTGRRYTHIIRDTGVGMADIVFSASSDLVVLLERRTAPDTGMNADRLHFRAISTGGPHPEATLPHVENTGHPLPPYSGLETWLIQLYGDMVAFLLVRYSNFIDRRGGVTVWNWKSGEVVMPFQKAVASMFLSEDQLLLVVNSDEDLLGKLHMVVYSISKGCITHRIRLPWSNLSCPTLYTYPRQSLTQLSSAQLAGNFAPDPSLDIFALDFWPIDPATGPCVVVFSTQRLLKACEAALVGQESYPVDLDWNTWGPQGSRWFPPYCLRPPSERSIHGARMIAYTHSNGFDVSEDIGDWKGMERATHNYPVILDFNPRPILRGVTDCDFDWCRNTVVRDTWKWTIQEGDQDVVIESSLPFRALVNKEEWAHSDLHLHSTAVVCTRAQSHDIFSFLEPAGRLTRVDTED